MQTVVLDYRLTKTQDAVYFNIYLIIYCSLVRFIYKVIISEGL